MHRLQRTSLFTAALVLATVGCNAPPPNGSIHTGSGVSPLWQMAGPMTDNRIYHSATLLPNGKVLVAGGFGFHWDFLPSAELYDPAKNEWTSTFQMSMPRQGHSATLLNNGKVLVAGGEFSDNHYTQKAEIYDPATGTWARTGSMTYVRGYHTATLLPDGRVLIAGGRDGTTGNPAGSAAEIFDPTTGTWTVTGAMVHWRDEGHKAMLLPNGKVLVAGGHANDSPPGTTAELYDPASGTWTLTGSFNEPRMHHTLTMLPNGKVLAAGGQSVIDTDPNSDVPTATAELYDPATGTWTYTGKMAGARRSHTATPLPNGKVVVAGGSNSGALKLSAMLTTVEVYDPASGTWTQTSNMLEVRGFHTAVLLQSNQLLVSGGWGASTPYGSVLTTAELQDESP